MTEEALGRLAAWDDWALGLVEASFRHEALELWSPLVRRELARGELQDLRRRLAGRRGAEAAAARGRVHRLLGDDGAARRELEAAAARRAPSPAARLWLAELEVESRPAAALARLSGLAGPHACLLRGLAELRRRRPLEAARRFAEAEAGLPRPFPAALLRALALRRAGRPLEAAAAGAAAPDEAAARDWQRAYALHEAGDFEAARAAAGAALARYPEFELDRLLGLPRREVHRPSRHSLERLGRLSRSGPYRVFALTLRSVIWASPAFARYGEAASDLRAASELEPRSAWLQAYLGRALGNVGDHEGARRALDLAASLAPRGGWVLAWRGCYRYRCGERGAIADLDAAVRLAPYYSFARAWRGGALRLLGRHEEAAAELELGARLEPIYEWSYAELFQVRRAQRRWAEAARWLTEAFERDPKFSWSGKGQAPGTAAAELSAGLRAAPRDALLRSWRAALWLAEGQTERAAAALGRVDAGEPAYAAFMRGRVAAAQGRVASALSFLTRAAAARPAAPYLRARGELLWSLGRLGEAGRELERAVEANGTVAAALWLLAAVRVERGRLPAALALLDRALGLHADYPEALALRAECLRRLGRPAEARRELERALRLRADGPWALWAGARLTQDPVEAAGLLKGALERAAELPPRLAALWRRELGRRLKASERLVRPYLSGRADPASLARLRRLSPSFWSALIKEGR